MARVIGIAQFLPATHTTILTSLRKHSPDGTTRTKRHTSDIAYYAIYRPLKDERLSWPSWLTYSGRLTHISGHPSAAGRAWDRKVRRSKTNVLTTVSRNQPKYHTNARCGRRYNRCNNYCYKLVVTTVLNVQQLQQRIGYNICLSCTEHMAQQLHENCKRGRLRAAVASNDSTD